MNLETKDGHWIRENLESFGKESAFYSWFCGKSPEGLLKRSFLSQIFKQCDSNYYVKIDYKDTRVKAEGPL